ncbi:hypothetical protein BGW36DRAFT_421120 [Talaromyces proteolyticus]|uniref:2-methylcitrate dehydratase n=1 Tax=Talaromyces proteolyticus TaxID=1131652 RepID=A0AAD4KD77_9EURO|nr:uncharacterized protein BGW36DRAFT_421120 [Talaromyces proteolyticus]KAH8688730.1 hypothetical protein BGW36DRAFT_421120 [Talaromyces proteolyticus]
MSTSLDERNGGAARTTRLAKWAIDLQYEGIPKEVVERTKELFLDWVGCAIAGRHHPAVSAIAKYAVQMGPTTGKSEFIDGSLGLLTSPAFAALVNGAASHVVEQDDLHNRSMMHPATVIFPAALAVAQDIQANGKDFIAACVVGYEVACRVGEYLGRNHYEMFHSTATGGVVGVAAAVSHLLRHNMSQMLSAIGTAGTQAAGLWQFLIDASHSKQVHTGKACFDGIFAAYVAKHNLLGPKDILEGPRGMGNALGRGSTSPEAIDQSLGIDFAVLQSSFKWHASCRHTHPSVDALLSLMQKHALKFDDIESVVARTYQAAINVLGLSGRGETVHQSKFTMGFVLAVAAKYGQAMITDFTEEALRDPALRNFQDRVTMKYDAHIDSQFPQKWQGTVEVTCNSGKQISESVEYLKGDPQLPLTRLELEAKTRALFDYGGYDDTKNIERVIQRVWQLEDEVDLLGFSFE